MANIANIRADAQKYTTNSYCILSRGAKIGIARKTRNRKNAVAKGHRVCTNRLGSTYLSCSKEERSLLLSADHKRLNSITKRDSYPIPPMDRFFDFVGKAVVLSTLNGNICNLQVNAENLIVVKLHLYPIMDCTERQWNAGS